MIQKAKGTIDILEDRLIWQYINSVVDDTMRLYNYKFIRTPIFEDTSLFVRGVGDNTDIVNKEMYSFKDKANRDISLRPEGTAGVIRSYIENKMYADVITPTKLYYNGTMYRYERPQNGRLREFTQFGCENLNSTDPISDAEVISLLYRIITNLRIDAKIIINTLGNSSSRKKYKEKLIKYLENHIDEFCSDCKERFKKNPLRILDCKKDSKNEILKNVPTLIDNMDKESTDRFNKVLEYLDILKIPYEVDNNLVRGLDYYDHTVFEIVAENKNIGSLGGGGRYSNLVKELDGPDISGVGFACGVDRIVSLIKEDEKFNLKLNNEIFILYVNEEEKKYAIYLTDLLRRFGFIAEMEYNSTTLKNQFKKSDRLNSLYNIILNSDDLDNNEVKVKNNITKEEDIINIDLLIYYLNEKLSLEDQSCNGNDCCCGEDCGCESNCSCGDDCNCSDECCKGDK